MYFESFINASFPDSLWRIYNKSNMFQKYLKFNYEIRNKIHQHEGTNYMIKLKSINF
jgi:hypothetical protein